jgi:hypothetical protein
MSIHARRASTTAAAGLVLGMLGQPAYRPATRERPPAPAATGAGLRTLEPCKLLTRQQVETVLPQNDGGTVAHAGGSLISGVDAYQCSYMNEAVHIFTVIVNVAVDDRRFAEIRPHFDAHEATRVAVGEGGWLRGEADDMKLTAVKGRSVLDLELLTPDAGTKSAALVTLARAAIAHL